MFLLLILRLEKMCIPYIKYGIWHKFTCNSSYVIKRKQIYLLLNKIINVIATWNYLTVCKQICSNVFKKQTYLQTIHLKFILTWPFGWAVWHSCRMGYQSMADSRLKGLQLRSGHLQVGELQPLSPMCSTRPCCLV